MKWLSLLFCSLCFPIFVFSQEEIDSTKFTSFKHEIALDFQAPIRNRLNGKTDGGNALATAMMYRRRLSPKKGKARALRLQVGGFYNLPLGSQDIFSNGSTGNNNLLVARNQDVSVFSFIGLERQQQINRVQLYAGIDLGVNYFREQGVLQTSTTTSGNVIWYREGKNTVTSVQGIGFFGIKYFVHPRFSVSYEVSMNNSVRFRREKRARYAPTDPEPIEIEFDYKRTELVLGFDYLRYFNLSYHF